MLLGHWLEYKGATHPGQSLALCLTQAGTLWWLLRKGLNTNPWKPLLEIDDEIRSLAEKVFASEVKDEGGRQEISPFDVDEICPISHHEMRAHMFQLEAMSTSTEGRR